MVCQTLGCSRLTWKIGLNMKGMNCRRDGRYWNGMFWDPGIFDVVVVVWLESKDIG